MKKPAIKPKYGRQLFTEALWRGNLYLFYARKYGKHLDRWIYTPEQLPIAVANRLGMQEAAVYRHNWMLGRFWNWVLSEDPHYIEFSGAHLKQLLEGGGFRTPDYVHAGATYEVRRDVVETCYKTLIAEPVSAAP